MSRLSFHNSLLTLSFGMMFAALTVVAQTQTLPHDTTIGHLETVATFNGPMPTGVTVSRTNRIFVNFPRWGDDVPFTVAEVIHGKLSLTQMRPSMIGQGESQPTPRNIEIRHKMKTTSSPCSRSWSTPPIGFGCSTPARQC